MHSVRVLSQHLRRTSSSGGHSRRQSQSVKFQVQYYRRVVAAVASVHCKPGMAIRAGTQPNYALKRTCVEEVSGAITRCGHAGRLA